MKTCEPSPPNVSAQMGFAWMSSAEAFPAKTSVLPVQERGSPKERARAYGLKSPVLLAKFDLPSYSWKTSQHCLIAGLTEFSGNWPRSGMMLSGIAYQLLPLVPLTAGTAFGLWHTPLATDGDKLDAQLPAIRRRLAAGREIGLAMQVRLWPTPLASDGVKMSTLSKARREAGRLPDSLPDAVRSETGSGALNPTWVEWLMGFPIGWTDCGDLATRSSRKSQS